MKVPVNVTGTIRELLIKESRTMTNDATITIADRLAVARQALRTFRDARHDSAQDFIADQCKKAGTTYNESCAHFSSVYQKSRAWRVLTKKLNRLEAIVLRLENIEIAKQNKANSKIKALADKKKSADELSQFNASIGHLRCYTWTARRQSCWGNVKTIYTIDAHGVELHRGKFRPTSRRIDSKTTYRNATEACAFHEGKGDLFFLTTAEKFSDAQIVAQLARKKTDPALTPNDVEYWKRERDIAHKSATKYAHLVEVLQRDFHPQNRYARWLKSVSACNSGIADALSSLDNSPYDTAKNGNEFQRGWLRSHQVDGIFPSWDVFE